MRIEAAGVGTWGQQVACYHICTSPEALQLQRELGEKRDEKSRQDRTDRERERERERGIQPGCFLHLWEQKKKKKQCLDDAIAFTKFTVPVSLLHYMDSTVLCWVKLIH